MQRRPNRVPNVSPDLHMPPGYRLVESGLAANRPGASWKNRGALYFATDTQAISYSNGMSWTGIAGIILNAGGGAPGVVHPTISLIEDPQIQIAISNDGVYDASDATFTMTSVGCRVYNSALQIIANNTETALTFDSERYDTDAFHSTSSNTNRITIPTGLGGRYLVGAGIEFAANATGARILLLKHSSGNAMAENCMPVVSAAISCRMSCNSIYQMAAGDYAEVTVYQNSGGNLNVTVGANYSLEFWCQRLGD